MFLSKLSLFKFHQYNCDNLFQSRKKKISKFSFYTTLTIKLRFYAFYAFYAFLEVETTNRNLSAKYYNEHSASATLYISALYSTFLYCITYISASTKFL